MVGANYTGGRRNAAKARSKDTTGRLQRGHFSKQRLGILTDALRSRPDHQSLSRSRPSAVTGNPNLNSACTPAATIHDISLGHAKRRLAQEQRRQSAQLDLHPHSNDPVSFSPSQQPGKPRLDPSVRNDLSPVTSAQSSTSLALTVKGKPDPAPSLQTLLPATASAAIFPSSPFLPQPQTSSHPEPAFPRASLPELQSKRRSKILDLLDISDRKRFSSLRIPPFPTLHMLGIPHHKITARLAVYRIAHYLPHTPPWTSILVSPHSISSLITALVIILVPEH